MKRKLISVMALLLMMAMLFTSCAVNYAKADMSKYVSLADAGFNGLTLSIEKQVYSEDAVLKRIYETLRTEKEYENKADKDKAGVSGVIAKYDEVSFYTWAVDADGNVALSNIVRDGKGNIAPETIGVGYGLNKDMLLALEKEFYDGTKEVDIADHLFIYTNKKEEIIPAEAFWFITFTSMTKPSEAGSIGQPGQRQSEEYVLNSSVYLEKDEQGTNDYYEAISLALKAMADRYAATEDKTDGLHGGDTVVVVNIYPTATPDEEITTTDETNAINLKYDIDFDGKAEDYDIGTISVTLKAAAYMDQETDPTSASFGFKATPIVMEYTFPEDYTGEYTVKGATEKKKLAGVTVDVYIYPTYKVSYNMPEYNPVTDEEKTELMDAIKAKMPSDLTDVDELKRAYENHVRTELEKAFVEEAADKARTEIWNMVVANTAFIKQPNANIKALVREEKRQLRYEYTTNSAVQVVDEVTGQKTYVTAEKSGLYDGYMDYAAKKVYSLATAEELENKLWADASDTVKQMMLTYYLADKLGLSVTDEEYNAKLNEEASAWIEQMKSFYALYYGVNLPLTVDDFIEAVGGEENIRSACLLEKVKDKLYEINKAGISYTAKEVSAIVEEKDDHDH